MPAISPFLPLHRGGVSNMTQIETARVKEVMGFKIAAVKDAAAKLVVDSDLQELEAGLTALEKSIADLKESLAGLPYRHQPLI